MKKNYLFRTAMCLGIATVLSLCMTAGTYAKYVGTLTSEDNTAKVAKFNFAVKGASFATSDTLNIELFEKSNVFNLGDTTDDGNIDNGGSDALIAPGSWGYVPIIVENTGEVTINAEFTIAAENNANSIPLKFAAKNVASAPAYNSIASGDWKDLADAIEDLNNAFPDEIQTAANQPNDKHTAYLVWKWDFDGNDSTDTTLGKAGTATYTISLTCTATQVN